MKVELIIVITILFEFPDAEEISDRTTIRADAKDDSVLHLS